MNVSDAEAERKRDFCDDHVKIYSTKCIYLCNSRNICNVLKCRCVCVCVCMWIELKKVHWRYQGKFPYIHIKDNANENQIDRYNFFFLSFCCCRWWKFLNSECVSKKPLSNWIYLFTSSLSVTLTNIHGDNRKFFVWWAYSLYFYICKNGISASAAAAAASFVCVLTKKRSRYKTIEKEKNEEKKSVVWDLNKKKKT